MPIKGTRFQCSQCEQTEYSLCQSCYGKRGEIHPNHKFYVAQVRPPPEEEKVRPSNFSSMATLPKAPGAPPKEAGGAKLQEQAGRQEEAETQEEQKEESIAAAQAAEGVAAATAPVVVAPTAEEEAKKLQQMWQNLGKSWQADVPALKEMEAKPAKKKKKEAAEVNKEKIDKPETPKPVTIDLEKGPPQAKEKTTGKWLPKNCLCAVCRNKVREEKGGVVCRRRREDGTDGGCRRGVCWKCMATPLAESEKIGKLRTSQADFEKMGATAWWMHEACMSAEDTRDYARMAPAWYV